VEVAKQKTDIVDIWGWLFFKVDQDPLRLLQETDRLSDDQKLAFRIDISVALDDIIPMLLEYRESLSLESVIANHLGLLKESVIIFTDRKLAARVHRLFEMLKDDPLSHLRAIPKIISDPEGMANELVADLLPEQQALSSDQSQQQTVEKFQPVLNLSEDISPSIVEKVSTDIRKLLSIYLDTYAQNASYAQHYIREWGDRVVDLMLSASKGQIIEFDDIPKIPIRAPRRAYTGRPSGASLH